MQNTFSNGSSRPVGALRRSDLRSLPSTRKPRSSRSGSTDPVLCGWAQHRQAARSRLAAERRSTLAIVLLLAGMVATSYTLHRDHQLGIELPPAEVRR